MSKTRYKTRSNTPFPPWATNKPDGHEKRYIRIGDSFMLSDAFRKLNHAAVVVYINMTMEAGGKQTFEMPRRKYEKFISRGGFDKAVDELVRYGFIKIEENNAHRKKPNVYRFVAEWKIPGNPTERPLTLSRGARTPKTGE